jgi:glycosyltransferase involved in cell wall biosynthesis
LNEPNVAITVVVPVWDEYVHLLPQGVESISAAGGDAAVLIVDNASRIPVPDLPGASVVRAPSRLTVGGARNLGVEHVTTEYLLVLDADDELLPGALSFMRSRLDADPALALCAMSILESATGERHRTPRRFVPRLARARRLFAFADAIWSLVPIQGCALMRTDQVRDCGGYADSDWGDDWVLAVSLAFRGRVEVSDRLGRLYRSTPESVSGQSRGLRDYLKSARLVRERIRSDPGIPRLARALLPLVGLLQLVALGVVRPIYRGVSRAV